MTCLTPEGLEELHRRWVWYAAHDTEIHAYSFVNGVWGEVTVLIANLTARFSRCTLLQRPDVSFRIECDRNDASVIEALLPRLLKLIGYLLEYKGDAQVVTDGWCTEAFALPARSG